MKLWQKCKCLNLHVRLLDEMCGTKSVVNNDGNTRHVPIEWCDNYLISWL